MKVSSKDTAIFMSLDNNTIFVFI